MTVTAAQTAMTPARPVKIAANRSRGTAIPMLPNDHLLLVLALLLDRPLALVRTAGESLFDPFDERVDQLGLHLRPDFLPRLDRRLQLISWDELTHVI